MEEVAMVWCEDDTMKLQQQDGGIILPSTTSSPIISSTTSSSSSLPTNYYLQPRPPPPTDDNSSNINTDGWGSLPEDLLGLLLNKLSNSGYDYLRCAAVCKSWFSAAQSECNRRRQIKQLPLLLIPTVDGSQTHRRLYNIIDNNKNNDSKLLSPSISVPYCKRCCGSSHGWLIFAEETLALTLFNPFSGETIHLPPLMSETQIQDVLKQDHDVYHEYEIKKVVLSGDPSDPNNNYQVLALQFEGRVALYSSRDGMWIYAKNYFDVDLAYFRPKSDDIICFKQKFYGLIGQDFVSIEVCRDELDTTVKPFIRLERVKGVDIQDIMLWGQSYLAESITGTLLYVERFTIGDLSPYYGEEEEEVVVEEEEEEEEEEVEKEEDDLFDHELHGYFEIDNRIYEYRLKDYNLTWSFRVYELEETEGSEKKEFVELGHQKKEGQRGLGDQALFLGFNQSVSVRASDFPGCKPNSIYFTDDYCLGEPYQQLGPIDFGVYTLGDELVKPLYMLDTSHTHLPPPIWIVPQPNLTFVR